MVAMRKGKQKSMNKEEKNITEKKKKKKQQLVLDGMENCQQQIDKAKNSCKQCYPVQST